jgi:hypothetical protein
MEPHDTIKRIEDCLSVIESSALLSAKVVKDLLCLNGRGKDTLQPFDMNTILCIPAKYGCANNIREAYQNVTVTTALATEPLVIMADKSHLERAVGKSRGSRMVYSGIGDFTWPSRRVVRELGKSKFLSAGR